MMTLIDSAPRIVVLNQGRDDPAGIFVEVYDHPQPASRSECILAVEALAARPRVLFVAVRSLHRDQDLLDMVEQPTTAAFGEMEMGTGVKDDGAPIGIADQFDSHAPNLVAAGDTSGVDPV
jgi:hypothetical protein